MPWVSLGRALRTAGSALASAALIPSCAVVFCATVKTTQLVAQPAVPASVLGVAVYRYGALFKTPLANVPVVKVPAPAVCRIM